MHFISAHTLVTEQYVSLTRNIKMIFEKVLGLTNFPIFGQMSKHWNFGD